MANAIITPNISKIQSYQSKLLPVGKACCSISMIRPKKTNQAKLIQRLKLG